MLPNTRVEHTATSVRGTVRFHGTVENSPDNGVYAGVEWDKCEGGKYDGEIFGKRYFTAPPKSSSFIKEGKLRTGGDLSSALVAKYETAELHAKSLLDRSDEYNKMYEVKTRVMNVHLPKAVQRDSNGVFSKLVNVSASGMRVSTCGALFSNFPSLTDLSLSYTLWSSWAEVANVLGSLPRLTVLSLAGNHFEPLTEDCGKVLAAQDSPPLTSLTLTDTNLTWNEVVSLATLFPTLTELNCSNNKYKNIWLKDLPALKTLRLDNNEVQSWNDVCEGLSGLGELTSLHLSGNPLQSVTSGVPVPPKLKCLYLRKTAIADWESVDALAAMGVRELAMSDTPLTNKQTEHERRCLMVARVPTLEVFNRGVVTKNERIDSERFLVRYYHDAEDPPKVWDELSKVHGKLQPLVDIDMSPKLTACVTVRYLFLKQETPAVVNVRQTVAVLYSVLCKPFSLDPTSVVLTHVDPEVAGTPHERQSLTTHERHIHTYRIKDGDFIEVAAKAKEKEEEEAEAEDRQ